MNELGEICGADVSGWTADQLTECVDYTHSLAVTAVELWFIIGAAMVGFAAVLAYRLAALASGPGPVGFLRVLGALGLALEGMLYSALAAYAGTVFGLLFAELVAPMAGAVLLALFGVVALFFAIYGVIAGNGKGGWKALGFLELAAVSGGLAAVAALGFLVPGDGPAVAEYQAYVSAVTWLFGVAAVVDAVLIALFGSFTGWLGWLIVPVNASWGALGGLLGLMHHAASWNCYAKHGDIRLDNRRFYTCYDDGFRLKGGFAFTAGAVTTPKPVERHEAQHVLQHLLFGPIFTLTYSAWFVIMLIPGAIAGVIAGKGVVHGVEAYSYYNNPFEVWAYAVQGGRSVNGDKTLIWGNAASWIVSLLYYAAGIAGLVVFLLVR